MILNSNNKKLNIIFCKYVYSKKNKYIMSFVKFSNVCKFCGTIEKQLLRILYTLYSPALNMSIITKTPNQQFIIPLRLLTKILEPISITIYYDNKISIYPANNFTENYPSIIITNPGTYEIVVLFTKKNIIKSELNFGTTDKVSRESLIRVNTFGELSLKHISFVGCVNLVEVPAYLPSTIISLELVFAYTNKFDQSLDKWNVSKVKIFRHAFYNSNFTHNLSSWNISPDSDCSYMFFQNT